MPRLRVVRFVRALPDELRDELRRRALVERERLAVERLRGERRDEVRLDALVPRLRPRVDECLVAIGFFSLLSCL